MYSSPATPAGTGRSRPSRTWTVVLAIGAPMAGAPGRAPSAAVVDQMVVSVGPYRLVSSA